MKRRKISILLSVIMLISAGNYQIINAEDSDNAENVDVFMSSDDGKDMNITEEDSNNEEDETFISDMDLDFESESDTDSAQEEMNDEADNVEDFGDSWPEIIPDESYNLKNYFGSVELNDIFVGNDISGMLKVSILEGEQNAFLDAKNYRVVGYVNEEEYLNADHMLDNLNHFLPVPDAVGTWFLVAEGVTPYYGRLAVRIVVHDTYDISMYDWMSDGEVLIGENPKEALHIYSEQDNKKHQLSQEDYYVIGYISETEYENAGADVEKITEFSEFPDKSGRWLMVVKGAGIYYGKLAGWITVTEERNIGLYQCVLTQDRILLGERIQEYIQSISDSRESLTTDDYRVLGVIREKDFITNGYDVNNMENVQESANEEGGWYLLIEGVGSYCGKLAVWFEVDQAQAE